MFGVQYLGLRKPIALSSTLLRCGVVVDEENFLRLCGAGGGDEIGELHVQDLREPLIKIVRTNTLLPFDVPL